MWKRRKEELYEMKNIKDQEKFHKNQDELKRLYTK